MNKVYLILRWDNPNMDVMIDKAFSTMEKAEEYLVAKNLKNKCWVTVDVYPVDSWVKEND